MHFYDDLPEFAPDIEEDIVMPSHALCLKVPRALGDELVVHRDKDTLEDCVFLFEALDDAQDYALLAQEKLGVTPLIARIPLRELHFRTARFKPATGAPVDLPLQR